MPDASITQPIDPDALAKRMVQSAHTRDGLPEMRVGTSFLFFSGLIFAQAMLPRGSLASKAAAVTLMLLIPLLTLGSPSLLRRIRRRYLIGKVGYVEFRPVGRRQIGLGIALAVAMVAVLFLLVPRLAQPDRWFLAGTGLLGGALAAWCGRQTRVLAGGVLLAAAGVFVAFSGVPLEAGFALLFGFQGLITLASGSLVFLRFMRQPGGTSE